MSICPSGHATPPGLCGFECRMNDVKQIEVSGGVEVAPALVNFINQEVLPGTGITENLFWSGLSALLRRMAPRNAQLLAKRSALQARLDAWHQRTPGVEGYGAAYEAMLGDIGYLVADGPDFQVSTADVDAEMATIAGPQLVVPVSNA